MWSSNSIFLCTNNVKICQWPSVSHQVMHHRCVTPWLLIPPLRPESHIPQVELVALEMMFNHLSGTLRISALHSNLTDVHVQRMIPTLQRSASVGEADDPEIRFLKTLEKILGYKAKADCKEYRQMPQWSQGSLWL